MKGTPGFQLDVYLGERHFGRVGEGVCLHPLLSKSSRSVGWNGNAPLFFSNIVVIFFLFVLDHFAFLKDV